MSARLESQSFLGAGSDTIFAECHVGIVGLGGGGSHIVQQLAHLGVGNFVPVDHDVVEEKNLNRLVGATADDAKLGRAKTEVAERLIKGINPLAVVTPCRMKWQNGVTTLRRCDVIFGCVDSYRERDELERFACRHLIPYFDLGMDVYKTEGQFSVGGQAVLSSPGGPCLRCLGIVTDDRIAREAERYGDAGSRPQVVWANGVLASLAVGLFVQLVCPWRNAPLETACCEFDGNHHRVESSRLDNAGNLVCGHYQSDELGDAFFGR
jgi:molybdopterin-synthase adenylyltransferase